MISDIAAGMISIKYDSVGKLHWVSACASSSNALIDAINYWIRQSRHHYLGGSEASVTEAGVGGFNAIKALCTRNEDPQRASHLIKIETVLF